MKTLLKTLGSLSKSLTKPLSKDRNETDKKNGLSPKVRHKLIYFLIYILKKFFDVFLVTILFFILVFVYRIITGINYELFTSLQVEEYIKNEVDLDNNFLIEKYLLDLKGYGSKDLLLHIKPKFTIEKTLEENLKFRDKIVIFSEVQKNPLQKLIFSKDIYKKEYELEFEKRIEIYDIHILNSEPQKRVIFKIKEIGKEGFAYAILYYQLGMHEIKPLIYSPSYIDVNNDKTEISGLNCSANGTDVNDSNCYDINEETYNALINQETTEITASKFNINQFYIDNLESEEFNLYLKKENESKTFAWFFCNFEAFGYHCMYYEDLDEQANSEIQLKVYEESRLNTIKSYLRFKEALLNKGTQ